MSDMPPIRLLLVEDDVGIGRLLERGLGAEGYRVDWVRDLATAAERLRADPPGLVVLDRMLPDGDGADLCSAIRKSGNEVPICMLTAREALDDKLEGFDAGADDYVVKPFEFDELLARLSVMVRRVHGGGLAETAPVTEGASRTIRMAGRSAEFTPREWPLIVFLLENRGTALSRATILDRVWSEGESTTENAVDVYVGYLRRKIAAAGLPLRIETVRGVGYRLSTD